VHLGLDDGSALVYSDVRRLGTFAVATPEQFGDINSALGVEPLDPEFTADRLSGILRGSGKVVKSLLMEQGRIAGCGNIYASEALWRAGIDPSRRARSLSEGEALALREGLVAVLSESISVRGTTFRDYRDATGGRGGFAERLAVYGRGGKPCLRCRRRLAETHAIDGRSTVFCYGCQW
jgi:formamidopyrimidine-DNA glycosylase